MSARIDVYYRTYKGFADRCVPPWTVPKSCAEPRFSQVVNGGQVRPPDSAVAGVVGRAIIPSMSRKPGIAALVVCLAYAGAASVCARAYAADSAPAAATAETTNLTPVELGDTGDESRESEPQNTPVVLSAGLPVGVLDQGQRTPRAALAPRLVPDRVATVFAVVHDIPKVDARFEADAVSAGAMALLILARPVRQHAPPA